MKSLGKRLSVGGCFRLGWPEDVSGGNGHDCMSDTILWPWNPGNCVYVQREC